MVRILAVEDDKDILLLYENLFNKVGADFFQATNYDEMIKILSTEKIDIILMDYFLKDFGFIGDTKQKHTGLSLTKMITSNPSWKEIPVVIITAQGFSNEVQKAMQFGAADVIYKPFKSIMELPIKLEQIIKNRQKSL